MPHPAYIVGGASALAVVMGIASVAKFETSSRPNAQQVHKAEGSYLFPNNLPDSLTLLPPPPMPNSPEMQEDLVARAAALKLQGTSRYTLAISDAHRDTSSTLGAFTCALGTDISTDRTPTLYKLLGFVRIDVRASANLAKRKYARKQPFRSYGSSTCSPADEAVVQDLASYPSARAAVGLAYGLALAELNPSRADLIVNRGREFGESRKICDASWQSDVNAGFKLAQEIFARLQQSERFRQDLQTAKAEIASELRRGTKPPAGCSFETAALAPKNPRGTKKQGVN